VKLGKKIKIPIAITTVSVMLFLLLAEIYYRNHKIIPGVVASTFYGLKVVDSLIEFHTSRIDSNGLETLIPKSPGINSQGFKASFDYTHKMEDSLTKLGNKIVWIIGDSFVEGVTSSCDNQKTFVEIIRKNCRQKGYSIWAFGKAGTDPKNYHLIAKKFLCQEKLKPFEIIVSYCGDNDGMAFERKVSPYIPIQFCTNAGMLYSNPPFSDPITGEINHILPNADSAYKYYLHFAEPIDKHSLWWIVCSHSALMTKLYGASILKQITSKTQNDIVSTQASYKYLSKIDSICRSQNIDFKIAYIPPMSAPNPTSDSGQMYILKKTFGPLFEKVFLPTNLTEKDYIHSGKGISHFTDSGNEKFAEFIQCSVLK
jgi:hypothetical protein